MYCVIFARNFFDFCLRLQENCEIEEMPKTFLVKLQFVRGSFGQMKCSYVPS